MAGGFPQRGCLCCLSCPQRNLGDRPKLLPIQNCPSGFCSTTGLRETPNLVGPFCGAGAKGGFRVPVMVPARLHPGLLPHSHLSSALPVYPLIYQAEPLWGSPATAVIWEQPGGSWCWAALNWPYLGCRWARHLSGKQPPLASSAVQPGDLWQPFLSGDCAVVLGVESWHFLSLLTAPLPLWRHRPAAGNIPIPWRVGGSPPSQIPMFL